MNQTIRKKSAEDLSELERFALDAYFVNKNVELAYRVGRNKTEEEAKLPSFRKMAIRWVNLPHCKEYLTDRTTISSAMEKKNPEQKSEAEERLRTKDGVINALVAELKYTRGKARADLLMKIADLQRMKQKEDKKEEKLIHFYLPLPCYKCSLYLEAKERKQKELREKANK